MAKHALAAIASLCLLVWSVPVEAAQRCEASHYGVGDGYGGRRTANGEIMNPRAMTAAMRKPMPFGARVRVTHRRSGRSVVVRVNDRGPFHPGRCVDLSWGAARALGIAGTGSVIVERAR